jgi:hypothetical protein
MITRFESVSPRIKGENVSPIIQQAQFNFLTERGIGTILFEHINDKELVKEYLEELRLLGCHAVWLL